MARVTYRLTRCGDVTPTDPPLVLVQRGPGGVVLAPLGDGETPQQVVEQFRAEVRMKQRERERRLTRRRG